MAEEMRPLRVFADGVEIGTGLRKRVRGCATMTLMPNVYFIDIYNMSEYDAAVLQTAKIISATGEDSTQICYGEFESKYVHLSDMAEITTITVSDGMSFWQMTCYKTLGGGTTVSTTIKNLLNNEFLATFNAEDKRIIRSQTYSGHLPEIISMLAKSVNSRVYFMDGQIIITSRDKAAVSFTIYEEELNQVPEEVDGMLILKTGVMGYVVGTVCIFRNNRYRIAARKIDADNWSGNWRNELTLVNELLIGQYGMGGG